MGFIFWAHPNINFQCYGFFYFLLRKCINALSQLEVAIWAVLPAPAQSIVLLAWSGHNMLDWPCYAWVGTLVWPARPSPAQTVHRGGGEGPRGGSQEAVGGGGDDRHGGVRRWPATFCEYLEHAESSTTRRRRLVSSSPALSNDIHSNDLDKRAPMIFPGQCLPGFCCRHLSYLATICLIWPIDSAAELQRQPFLCSSARRTFHILVFFVCN